LRLGLATELGLAGLLCRHEARNLRLNRRKKPFALCELSFDRGLLGRSLSYDLGLSDPRLHELRLALGHPRTIRLELFRDP